MNKYLERLNLNDENWIKELEKYRNNAYIPDETGLSDADTYDMRKALAATIYIYLKKFQETNKISYPAKLTPKKWDDTLQKMLDGFASIIKDEESHRAYKRQKRALALFRTWFFDLWW